MKICQISVQLGYGTRATLKKTTSMVLAHCYYQTGRNFLEYGRKITYKEKEFSAQ
jgi:hypothetical protein